MLRSRSPRGGASEPDSDSEGEYIAFNLLDKELYYSIEPYQKSIRKLVFDIDAPQIADWMKQSTQLFVEDSHGNRRLNHLYVSLLDAAWENKNSCITLAEHLIECHGNEFMSSRRILHRFLKRFWDSDTVSSGSGP